MSERDADLRFQLNLLRLAAGLDGPSEAKPKISNEATALEQLVGQLTGVVAGSSPLSLADATE